MTLHYIMKHLSADLSDEHFLLLVDLLSEAMENGSSELFLQVDEEGRSDVETVAALTVDGKPLFAEVSYTENEELLDVQLKLAENVL